MRLVLEAHAGHELGVEVARLRAHAADVEAERRLDRPQRIGDVVVDHHRHVHRDLEAVGGLGELSRTRRGGTATSRAAPSRRRSRAARRDVLRTLGAEVDRDVGPGRVRDHLQRLAEPDRALAGVGERVVRAGVATGPSRRRTCAGCPRTRGFGPAAGRTAGRTSPPRPAGRTRRCRAGRGPRVSPSSVIACMAIVVGLRADICAMPVASLMRVVWRRPTRAARTRPCSTTRRSTPSRSRAPPPSARSR